ncbi:hypothetical protein FQA39_LY19175 [Lamprigera yunnana]|nr:hypothetical protein FQA39_LY19175 [Lamprigera yunnana]
MINTDMATPQVFGITLFPKISKLSVLITEPEYSAMHKLKYDLSRILDYTEDQGFPLDVKPASIARTPSSWHHLISSDITTLKSLAIDIMVKNAKSLGRFG